MASVVDFLKSQPPDIYQFVLVAIEPIWLDPSQTGSVAEAIKQKYPGRFSEQDIFNLIAGALTLMR